MLRLNCDSTRQGDSGNFNHQPGVLNMSPRPSSYNLSPSYAELVEEITSIEIEILHLERYLLSIYRTHHHVNGTASPPIADKLDEIPKSSSRKSGHRSLGDHLGTPCTDFALPDRLSEDMVKCISSIYCKLGDSNQGPSDSSDSSLSTSSTISTKNLSDYNDERGPYGEMIQVLRIGLDDDSFNYAATMLQHFRTLIKKLETIDVGKMKREQKLAFWINIHNALVMHAHLAYGTHSNLRTNSILKATYNVGGQCINAYIIQNSILGIRSHFRASWLQSLLSPGRKSTTVPHQHIYAIDYPEPLVHFALSLGTLSDPAVRVYKANNIFGDLRVAKEEFIRSNVHINREYSKVSVPKILYYFAKDMALTVPGLLEMVNACLPESQRRVVERNDKGKTDKYVCWLSQSSVFRYLIHRDAIER
ncbi:hypothetical protein LXL04_015309 [Taraxacum kok-saghyz]